MGRHPAQLEQQHLRSDILFHKHNACTFFAIQVYTFESNSPLFVFSFCMKPSPACSNLTLITEKNVVPLHLHSTSTNHRFSTLSLSPPPTIESRRGPVMDTSLLSSIVKVLSSTRNSQCTTSSSLTKFQLRRADTRCRWCAVLGCRDTLITLCQ